MSQKTFKGFPFFSGSIQYSPFPLEYPESRMCLQELESFRREEYQPKGKTEKIKMIFISICLKYLGTSSDKTKAAHNGFQHFP